ncbi:MAG: hypothetical protein J7M15_06265 [Anaerolineae bacterium]|nr:hypothetical protein [Anaerolineae bacterium]
MNGGSRRAGRWHSLGVYVTLFLCGAAYMAAGIRRPLNVYDEGLILHGAERVLLGELPYKGFWTVYAPGQYYLLAALFRLFGSNVLVARVYDTLVRSALALMGYHLTREAVSSAWALGVWGFLVAWLGFFEFYLYPAYLALFLCLVAILWLQKACGCKRAQSGRWWWLTGCALGAAALFRHDFAAYGFAVASVVGGVWLWREGQDQHGQGISLLRAWGRMLGGATLVAGPLYLWLGLAAGPETLWDQLVWFPATVFAKVRNLPFPRPTGPLLSPSFWEQCLAYLPYYVPVCLAVVGLLLAIRRLTRHEPMMPAWVIWASLSGLSLLLFQQARVRTDLVHNVPMLVLMPMVLAGIACELGRSSRAALVRASVVACAVALLLLAHPFRERQELWQAGFPWALVPPSRIAKAYPVPVDRQLETVALKLRSRTDPEDRIYVGVGTHDKVFVNEPLIYFLADRVAGTRYHELHPGQATTRAVQQEIIGELEQHDVHWIVISTRFDGVHEPNASAIPSGVRDLDRYIQRNYAPVEEIGPYTILTRKAAISSG